MVSFHVLFVSAFFGFVTSAALIYSVRPPRHQHNHNLASQSFRQRLTKGMHICLATHRWRALVAINLVTAASGTIVIVNIVILMQGRLGAGDVTLVKHEHADLADAHPHWKN